MDSLIGIVPDNWTENRLDTVCDVVAGASIPQNNLKPWESSRSDVPVVGSKDLRHNRITYSPSTGVTSEVARDLSRYQVRPADIVCTRTGQLGRQGLVGEHQAGWLVGSGCLRIRVRRAVNASYLVYYLSHPAVRDWILRNAGGAVIPSLSTRMIGSLPVVIPPAAVQADAAAVLGALDDKIVVHEQIARTTAELRDVVLLRLLSGESSAEA